MSWIRERLGLEKPKAQSNEDKYGIRERLGLSNSASRNEKTDNLSTQRNLAAEKLAASRQNYQDYLAEQTKEARSQIVSPLSSQPTYDLSARRNEMEQLAIQNAQAQTKAKSTEKAKELKQDIKQKQSEYNYANYLKNQEEVENKNYNFGQKILNPIVSGVADLLQLDRLNPEEQYYYDSEGNKSYLPTKRSLKQQKIRQESGGALGVYNDVAYNMSKAASSKLLDMVTFGGGSMLYYGDIMLDSTEEAKKQGFNNTEAIAYGVGVTGLAKVLDNVIGTFGGLSNASDKIPTMSQGLDKFFTKVLTNKTAATILSNMTSEALNEYYEEYADNILKYIINSDQSGYDSFMDMISKTFPDALYSGLVGGISGGVGGTIENITNGAEIQERKQALEDYKVTLENYKPQTVEEANYKNDEINKVDNALEQLEQQEEKITQEENTEEENTQEEKTEETASKEKTEPTYKTAENIVEEPEDGYKTYYGVEPEEMRDIYGYKTYNSDITVDKLNQSGIDLITYYTDSDGKTKFNVYEFDSKKDFNKYIKDIGGYSQLDGKYTIKSNIKDGEFYYVRDRMAKGGWAWQDVNGDNVKGWTGNRRVTKVEQEILNEQIATKGKELGFSDKEIAYKQVQVEELENNKVTKDTTMEQAIATGNVIATKNGSYQKTLNERTTDQVISLVTPTEKKVVVNTEDSYGNKTTIKKPSKKSLEGAKNNSEILDKLESTKTTSQKAQDRNDELKLERTYDRRKSKIDDDTRLTEYEKTEIDHMFKSLSLNELEQKWADAVTEDIDDVIEKLNVEVLNKEITPDTIAKAAVLAKYYDQKGMFEEADKYYQIASTALHNPATTLATAKLLYQDNPMGAYMSYMRSIEDLYKHDSKYHKNDIEWHEKNDLFNSDGSVNEDSPYRLPKDVKNDLGAKIREWYDIENPNSKEAKRIKMEIDTMLSDNLPSKPKIERILDFRRASMLNSVGIWIKNSRQELIDLSVGILTDIGSSPSDRYLQKVRNEIENQIRVEQGEQTKQKRYRTTSIKTISGKVGIDGYRDGVKNHWESVKNDVVLNRYSELTVSNTDRISATTKIKRQSNSVVQNFIDKANALGMGADERFREAYFAVSLYDQQSQFALNLAANQNKPAVARTELTAAGADITFADPETKTLQHEIVSNISTPEELIDYLDQNYISPTEKDVKIMLDRASQQGNYRTMQDSGALTRFTSNMLKIIDNFTIEHLHVPLGSAIAPFYRASTESLRTLYKSSPLAAIEINNKINAFKKAVRENATGVNTNNNLFDMQYALAKDIGQAVGGTMALIVGGAIVKALSDKGIIVGNKADDKKDEKEYTLKIGDRRYSFNIDTVTTNGLKFLSILSDSDNISKKEGDSIIKNIETTMFNMGNPIIDMVIEQTALNAFAEYGESRFRSRGENIAYQFSRIPASFVPTLSKNLASIIDAYTARDTSADTMFGKMVNAVGSKIPLVRSLYAEKKDKWNSTEEAGLNILEKAWNSLVTDDISVSKLTPLDQELYDIYLATGSTDAFPTSALSNEFTRGTGDNKAKYTLSKSEQKKYQADYGDKAFDTVQKLMDTNAYKNANSKDRLVMLRAAYTYAKTYAQNKYLDTKEVYYDEEETAIEKVINQDISYTSAQYQKENPNRWKLYTSIVSDYDDYKDIAKKITDIKDTYSSANGFNFTTRRNMVVDYVNGLNNLSATKKAMLIKLSGFQSSYGSYDNAIYSYLDGLNLTEEEYNYFIKESNLGLKGYYTTIKRTK